MRHNMTSYYPIPPTRKSCGCSLPPQPFPGIVLNSRESFTVTNNIENMKSMPNQQSQQLTQDEQTLVNYLKNNGLQIVVIHWNACGPCKNLMNYLKQNNLLQKFSNTQLKAIEKDDPEAKPYLIHVSGFPTILILKDGKMVDKQAGVNGDFVKNMLSKIAKL